MRFNGAGRLVAGLAGLSMAGWTLPASAAGARAPRALVIGDGAYTSLPALPACPASAKLIASALRGLGFEVTERESLSSGALNAALGNFSQSLAAGPDSPALVYVCGYAIAFNDRDFLLPISAAVSRASDVLAQGLLAKSVVDTLTRAGIAAGVVVLDSVPMPAPGAPPLGFDSLKTLPLPDGVGLVAATESAPPDGPTLLAGALAASLKGPSLSVADLIGGLRAGMPSPADLSFPVLRSPAGPSFLVGAPGSPPTFPPAPPPIPVPAPPPVEQTAPAEPAPAVEAPDEAHMAESQRRRVQIALAQLGYYGGRIDGVFGPDTRAAIRRYQHELKAEMTGTLTSKQAARLLASVR